MEDKQARRKRIRKAGIRATAAILSPGGIICFSEKDTTKTNGGDQQ